MQITDLAAISFAFIAKTPTSHEYDRCPSDNSTIKNYHDDEIRHNKNFIRIVLIKSKRFSVGQIVSTLKQHKAGLPIVEIARKLGIAERRFYAWNKMYVGLELDQVRKLKQLREENEKLKRIVEDLTFDKALLQDLNTRPFDNSLSD